MLYIYTLYIYLIIQNKLPESEKPDSMKLSQIFGPKNICLF